MNLINRLIRVGHECASHMLSFISFGDFGMIASCGCHGDFGQSPCLCPIVVGIFGHGSRLFPVVAIENLLPVAAVRISAMPYLCISAASPCWHWPV